jgi:hypothetical protein
LRPAVVFGGNVLGWTADAKTSFDLLDRFTGAGLNAIDKGAAPIYPMLPDAETLIADKGLLPTRGMIVMHSARLSPDAASRLAFHREPSAGSPQHTAKLCIDSATRSRTCSQS